MNTSFRIAAACPETRSPGKLAWRALWRSRADLANLDTAALRDIGLTRDEAATEAARPLWDAPANWRR